MKNQYQQNLSDTYAETLGNADFLKEECSDLTFDQCVQVAVGTTIYLLLEKIHDKLYDLEEGLKSHDGFR